MRGSASEKMHIYRVIPLSLLVLVTAALSVAFSLYNQLFLDEIVIVAYLDVIFLALLIFELEFARKRGQISANRATTFSKVAGIYFLCALLVFASAFLPGFCRPFMILPFLIYAISNEVVALICSFYMLLLFAITCSGNFYEILCYSILIVFGCVIAKAYNVKKFRIPLLFITICVSMGNLTLFDYLDQAEVNQNQMVYSGITSVITVLLIAVFYPVFRKESEQELHNRILDIMSEDYAVIKELRKYFPADYNHGMRVAEIAKRGALAAGLNAELCEAAGFYYRIGKWQGEPHVERGIKRAQALCFPVELTSIISEYYGEEHLPSTPESALVHMVDSITIKIAALQEDVGLSTWNQEMIIYQALNEFSNQGLYDASGLSMNHFLKIREFLAKENWII